MNNPRLISVVGLQNSGKTRAVNALVKCWVQQGLRVGVVKHDGHLQPGQSDDWEKPESDTEQFTASGASYTLLTGGGRTLLRAAADPDAADPEALCRRTAELAERQGQPLDIVVVEGFKRSDLPKVAVLRDESHVKWVNQAELTGLFAVIAPAAVSHLVAVDARVYDENRVDSLCFDFWHNDPKVRR
ncbi:molybdopterin-guanine dinucleotide biosynthesis protein B [Alicyclobacillus tolerans]|uniref:molybdopterin-guanine dinucleotide biosynthesis protein B n=1 Tax=Alicyclobacillus tolerans TaxID=90970 RepID=UPI001F01C3C5|nr:molybdopterin-guanine dinucleotide biosynthesis protein B [Alicyclobacillus tolerans]MCF8566346.1 molybdopterin-guanine dinucleotide biosynthesis protein B [Alicyclobacillus tolerans]